ncbi:class I SAM-dependent methyltransferase [Streptomyces huiliensis]|uniref:class I SAM-dependent methyltransferase n=1 Tax=Streptomyces huiliensis TaxID=2876027 RepID=UPI001CBB4DE7|nr:class I SAM-dependent methyltransferase [Streptomyces huiliensis]
MGYTTREKWQRHYADGKGFRPLGDVERALLAEHTPVPEGGGRALDVGCGTGELAAYLARLGYVVDAVDFAGSAVARAHEEYPDAEGVRWLRLDIERDDPADLHDDGYDLICLRLMYPFLRDRGRVLHALGERLRPGGALVVITPTTDRTPPERRGIALDEDEIRLLTAGWGQVDRLEADGLAVLALRGPCHGDADTPAVGKRPPTGRPDRCLRCGDRLLWPGPGAAPPGPPSYGDLVQSGRGRGPSVNSSGRWLVAVVAAVAWGCVACAPAGGEAARADEAELVGDWGNSRGTRLHLAPDRSIRWAEISEAVWDPGCPDTATGSWEFSDSSDGAAPSLSGKGLTSGDELGLEAGVPTRGSCRIRAEIRRDGKGPSLCLYIDPDSMCSGKELLRPRR